ncbi:hypothetical protein SAMN04488527_11277 [Aliiroseovarius crassostreae]|nr:hypothetical protein [Aliiroseovarius crassostreae]SFU72124.1 hypothetical protein SAMN04488527_11277 [Aliiroseovarius crassostreae]
MAGDNNHTPHHLFIIAVTLTTTAGIVYFMVWGLYLFPEGHVVGKLVWLLTCGIAMGLVIGALTYLWVEERFHGGKAILGAALVMASVGSYCTWICSKIDAQLGYFGSVENMTLFILSGVIPAVIGGLLYGWLIYGQSAKAT